MAKQTKTVAVVPLPPIKIIELDDPAAQLHIEPLNARFTLDLIDLSAEIDGKKIAHYWRDAVKDSDLIHTHQMEGKYFATDGNRRVATLRQLAETDPAAYRKMLDEFRERTGHGFRVALYKGDLSETQRLWALRDVDASQQPWTEGEKCAQFRRLINKGATRQQAAAFFGAVGSRMPDMERLLNLPDEVTDLWIETRRDEQLAKADPKNYTRKYSGRLTGPQVQELTKAVKEFREKNPGSTAAGPEYKSKLSEFVTALTTPKDSTAAYTPPKIPEAHRNALSPCIGRLVDMGERLAAQALAHGIGLALDEEKPENITRVMREDDIGAFKAAIGATVIETPTAS